MGVDKAGLRLGGQTLLAIAVSKLLPLCEEVVLIGTRASAPPGLRTIPDVHPGCGPMGGMEAALRDLHDVLENGRGGDQPDVHEGSAPGSPVDHPPAAPVYALFLPVDMPLLPRGLLRELLRDWHGGAAEAPPRVAMVEADHRVQPLVSMVHRDLLPAVERSLTAGAFKIRPVLESAAASKHPTAPAAPHAPPAPSALHITPLEIAAMRLGWRGWTPSPAEWRARSLWFGNLNTPEEFAAAENFADALGGA